MKKYLFLALSLAALLNFNNALAASNQHTKTATKPAQDSSLIRFNKNVEIKFKGLDYTKNDKQVVMNIHYSVRNKGSKASISSVVWDALFVQNKHVIFAQEIPLNFNDKLPPKASIDFDIHIPMDNIPEAARNIFLQKDSQITYYSLAKRIIFGNGAKLVVTQ